MVSNAQRAQERSIGCPLISGFYFIAAHIFSTPGSVDRFTFQHFYSLCEKKERSSVKIKTLSNF